MGRLYLQLKYNVLLELVYKMAPLDKKFCMVMIKKKADIFTQVKKVKYIYKSKIRFQIWHAKDIIPTLSKNGNDRRWSQEGT